MALSVGATRPAGRDKRKGSNRISKPGAFLSCDAIGCHHVVMITAENTQKRLNLPLLLGTTTTAAGSLHIPG